MQLPAALKLTARPLMVTLLAGPLVFTTATAVAQSTDPGFGEPSLWDRYRFVVLLAAVALLAQSALIGGLLIQTRRLQRSYDRIRDLGSRLLKAQESERARIARELHDDISQQVALLEIDLEQVTSGADRDPATLRGVVARTHAIARSLHDLSHRLHPAKLRLVGLVGALGGLQRELSQPGFVVTFTHADVSALSEDVTLCLFRIAQEALHNAVRHGKAGAATLNLRGRTHDVTLTVADTGAGFTTKGAGEGLGLVSMRERVEMLGGSFSIDSVQGQGTRVTATVPILHSGQSTNAGKVTAGP